MQPSPPRQNSLIEFQTQARGTTGSKCKHVAPHGITSSHHTGALGRGSSHVIPTPRGPRLFRPRTPRRAGDACMGPSPSRQTTVSAWAVAVSGGAGDDGSDRLCVALKRLGSAVSGSVVARPVCAAQVGPLHPVGGCFGGSLRPPRAGQGFGDEGIRSRPGRSQRHPSGTTPGTNRHTVVPPSTPAHPTRRLDGRCLRKHRSCSSGGQAQRMSARAGWTGRVPAPTRSAWHPAPAAVPGRDLAGHRAAGPGRSIHRTSPRRTADPVRGVLDDGSQ